MIYRCRIDGWKVLFSDEDKDAKAVFEKFLSLRNADGTVALVASGRTGPVYKITYGNGRTYILKHDLRKRHRFDYLVQSFFRGSNAFRLLKSFAAARARHPEFHNVADVLLVADRRRFHCVLESFILMEFVEGKSLEEIPRGCEIYRGEVASIVSWLHENGMAHGDVHAGNFIKEDGTGTIRAIDLSGKPPTPIVRASDRIRLEEKFGVPNTKKDWGFYYCKAFFSWRGFLSKLRGRVHAVLNRIPFLH